MLIKKRRKFFFFLSNSKIGYWLKDNQIDFLFSGHFHIGLVIIKQAGYIKKLFFLIIYQQSKKGSYQTNPPHKIGKKDKVSGPDSLNEASIRYSDI